MSDQPVSVPKVPDAPGWWWREEYGDTFAVNVREFGGHFGPRLLAVVDGVGIPVAADGCWLAPALTPTEAAALTTRAERAEAERDEARRWAENAAAAENANAAELREARATLDAIVALVGLGDVVERVAALVVALEQHERQERTNYSAVVEP